jgi:hypothetical protein
MGDSFVCSTDYLPDKKHGEKSATKEEGEESI